jgi:hypothetical protein
MNQQTLNAFLIGAIGIGVAGSILLNSLRTGAFSSRGTVYSRAANPLAFWFIMGFCGIFLAVALGFIAFGVADLLGWRGLDT